MARNGGEAEVSKGLAYIVLGVVIVASAFVWFGAAMFSLGQRSVEAKLGIHGADAVHVQHSFKLAVGHSLIGIDSFDRSDYVTKDGETISVSRKVSYLLDKTTCPAVGDPKENEFIVVDRDNLECDKIISAPVIHVMPDGIEGPCSIAKPCGPSHIPALSDGTYVQLGSGVYKEPIYIHGREPSSVTITGLGSTLEWGGDCDEAMLNIDASVVTVDMQDINVVLRPDCWQAIDVADVDVPRETIQ